MRSGSADTDDTDVTMTTNPATPGSGSRPKSRRAWNLDTGQAEILVTNATRAFFVMLGFIVVIWAVQIANWADSYSLSNHYGIVPHDVADLPHILTSPFLHWSWTHIEGNSGPLFIFGFLAAYRGIGKFLTLTVIVILTSGFAAWFFAPSNENVVGASGVVFGYFSYIIVRGLFDRHLIDVLIGAVMALCFAYQFSVLLPHQGISWQGHVGGVVGGVLAGWLLRERRAAKQAKQAVAPATGTQRSVFAPPGTAMLPASQATQATPASQAGKTAKAGKRGKGSAVDPANPRAELYKELDDLGL